MILKMSKQDSRAYQALYVARWDIREVIDYADFILKKGWHGWPVLRRGSVRIQQQATTSAMVIAYGRLWSPIKLQGFEWTSQPEAELHKNLMAIRNEVVGHSAPDRYSVRPWQSGDFSTHIFGQPHTCFQPEELVTLKDMVRIMSAEIHQRMLGILLNYMSESEANKIMRT